MIFGCGSKRKPQRGPQVDGSIFPFTNRVFRYPVFLTHSQFYKGFLGVSFSVF